MLDGIAWHLNGSFFYSFSVAMKRKKPEKRSKKVISQVSTKRLELYHSFLVQMQFSMQNFYHFVSLGNMVYAL